MLRIALDAQRTKLDEINYRIIHMSTPEERKLRWLREARIAPGIDLAPHSKPGKSIQCPGSTRTKPIDVKVRESRNTRDRLIRSIVGECPICGRVFTFHAPGQEWIVPRER